MNAELFGIVRREAKSLEPIHMERRILLPSDLGLRLWGDAAHVTGGFDVLGEDVIAKLHEFAAWGILLTPVPLDW